MCVGPYIFIIATLFQCSTIARHIKAEKPEGTIFCLLKPGSGATQIQRHLNRDNFNVSQMITHYVNNINGKQNKNAILNKKNHVVC